MAEEKTAVTGLVTEDILKQALASREVLNPLKVAVKKQLSGQIDAAVESLLTSLTGQAVDGAGGTDDAADEAAEGKKEHTVKEIDTGGNTETSEGQDTAQTAGDNQTGTQVSGEASATGSAAGTQAAEVKTTTTVQAQPAAAQGQKQA